MVLEVGSLEVLGLFSKRQVKKKKKGQVTVLHGNKINMILKSITERQDVSMLQMVKVSIDLKKI